jgi:hypothetical protein
MFWALKGATRMPCRRNQAQRAVATQLLPAFDDVPKTEIDFTGETESRVEKRRVEKRCLYPPTALLASDRTLMAIG